jgi:hypothetical protein
MSKRQYTYPPTVPGVMDKQLVETVKQAGFRKFNKQLMSQARRPQVYGIALQPAAVEAICEKHGIPLPDVPDAQDVERATDAPEPRRTRKGDGHRFTRIAGSREPDAVITQVNAYLQIDGKYKYISELMHALLMDWLNDQKQHIRRNI